jgi:hypothetical protein
MGVSAPVAMGVSAPVAMGVSAPVAMGVSAPVAMPFVECSLVEDSLVDRDRENDHDEDDTTLFSDFNRFWEAYPRAGRDEYVREEALRAFTDLSREDRCAAIAAAGNYRDHVAERGWNRVFKPAKFLREKWKLYVAPVRHSDISSQTDDHSGYTCCICRQSVSPEDLDGAAEFTESGPAHVACLTSRQRVPVHINEPQPPVDASSTDADRADRDPPRLGALLPSFAQLAASQRADFFGGAQLSGLSNQPTGANASTGDPPQNNRVTLPVFHE